MSGTSEGRVPALTELALQGSTVTLRKAVAEDVAAIVELLAADQLGADRDGITSQGDLQAYLRAFAAIDSDSAHLLLAAVDAGETVATIQLSFLPGLAHRGASRAQVEAVRVREDHRSRGLGEAMIGWALDEARREGCAIIQLTSDKSRANAHHFYERLGFIATHEGFKLTIP